MAKLEPFGWIFTPRQKDMKTIEVKPTPVVFCGNCEYYQEWRDGKKICLVLGDYWGDMRPNDFCSYGKPREGFTPTQFDDMQKRLCLEVSGDDNQHT